MNPTLNEYQSLLISADSNNADLGILLNTCEDYMLNRKIAEKIISEVIEAAKGWRELAIRLGIFKKRNGNVCRSVGWTSQGKYRRLQNN